MFPFLQTLLTTLSLTFRLWSSENQIVRVQSRSGRINQSQCTFPRFVIGLGLPLLLLTLKIWFSLDQKQNVSDTVVSGIRMLFSLDHKLYASDYDSDSDASENQPLEVARPHSDPSFALFLVVLEFGNAGFWREGKTGVPGEKPLRERERTNNKLNPPMSGVDTRAQLFEGRSALNPGLNLTRVSLSFVQKHFLR